MAVSKQLTFLGILLVFFGLGCGEDVPPPPDVSNIDYQLELLRFDRDLASLDTARSTTELARLEEAYQSFTSVYFTHLVPVYRPDFAPEERREVLNAYLAYPLTSLIDSVVVEKFPAGSQVLSQQREAVEKAMKYLMHYLPGASVPDTLVAFTSHFELAAFLYGEGQVAVGLDFFLGPDFDYSLVNPEDPIFSDYLTHAYQPAYMAGKVMRTVIDDYFPTPKTGRLIDYLIYEGKKLYLLELLLPETPEHIVYEVTEREMEWLRDNETQIYAYLQRENELYTTEPQKIRKYTQPAPYSPGMPRESPGGAVNYLGRRIVASFLRNNPDLTLEKLLALEDGQEILRRARYKPR